MFVKNWRQILNHENDGIHTKHFRDLGENEFLECDYIITNPSFQGIEQILHPMIE